MANEIFGVDISAIVSDVFTGNMHPVTLRKIARTTDVYGAPTETGTDYACEGVRSKWRSETVVSRGWPSDTAKIVILQNAAATPEKGDEVTILGDTWRILHVEQDPVNATWTVAGTMTA